VYCLGLGKAHQLLPIDDLFEELLKLIDQLSAEALGKEKIISTLIKKISVSISNYEEDTKEMVKLVHKTKEQQVYKISSELQCFSYFLIAGTF